MRGLLRGNPVIRGFRDFSEHTCYTAIERGDKKRLHIQCLSEQLLMRQHLRNVPTLLNSTTTTMFPPTILVVSTRVHPAQSAHSSQEDQSCSQRARTSLGTWEGRIAPLALTHPSQTRLRQYVYVNHSNEEAGSLLVYSVYSTSLVKHSSKCSCAVTHQKFSIFIVHRIFTGFSRIISFDNVAGIVDLHGKS